MIKRFCFSERVALTVQDGSVLVWTAESPKESKVFKNSKGSAVLGSDRGYWWNREKKEAQNCWYAQYWLGNFPYGSWCWAIRLCKVTGEVTIEEIETDINPRGMSTSDRWIQECKSYVPSTVTA